MGQFNRHPRPLRMYDSYSVVGLVLPRGEDQISGLSTVSKFKWPSKRWKKGPRKGFSNEGSQRPTQEILIIINEKNVKVFQNCPKLLQIFKLANCFNISQNCIFFLFSKLLELSFVFLKIVKNWYYFALFDKSVKVFQNCKKIQNCKNCQIVKLLSK